MNNYETVVAEARHGLRDREQEGDNGAGNEIRTRDPNLGKVVLYQLSYSRIFSITLEGKS